MRLSICTMKRVDNRSPVTFISAALSAFFIAVLFFSAATIYFGHTLVASAEDSNAASSSAQTGGPQTSSRIDELKQNISSHSDVIKKLEAEIAEYKNKLVDVGNQKKSLQSAVRSLDLTRAKLAADAKLTQVKILRATDSITALSTNIVSKQDHIDRDKRLIGDIMHKIDQSDGNTMLERMLGAASISDFIRDADDLGRLQVTVRDSIASLERLKADLGNQRADVQKQQKQLLGLRAQLADQKELADQQRRDQSQLLSDTKNQESNYTKLLADKQKRKKQFEKEMDDFEAALRAVIDPNSFPRPGTKVLVYPLDNVRITQKFGKTADSARLYAAGTHNGIDFAASPGTPIKAAADGVIAGTGNTDDACRGASYGRWVMVTHPNGLSTVYGHLQLIKVGKGQQVQAGDIIGYSGSTGYATGPHLHLTVLVSSAAHAREPSSTYRYHRQTDILTRSLIYNKKHLYDHTHTHRIRYLCRTRILFQYRRAYSG